MDRKQEREAQAELRQVLTQISLELEASAEGAKGAAEAIPGDRERAWRHVQQLYSRLQEATHLVERFQRTINDLVASHR